jgi:1,4-alpha-glucan branching enzyme
MVELCGQEKSVRFVFQHDTAGPVFVAGTFNNWNNSALQMRQVDNARWEVAIELPPGEHLFRYFANGNWYTDYAAHGIERNPQGQYNSVVSVPQTAEKTAATEKQLPSIKLRRPRPAAAQISMSVAEKTVGARMSAVS